MNVNHLNFHVLHEAERKYFVIKFKLGHSTNK